MRALYRKWFPKHSCPKCRDALTRGNPAFWCDCPAGLEAEKKADEHYWALAEEAVAALVAIARKG